MVILVVCLWYEHDNQLFDTEAAETDGNQMPFIAFLYHLCVLITSVMKTMGAAWHEWGGFLFFRQRSTRTQIKTDPLTQLVNYVFCIHICFAYSFLHVCMYVYFVYTLCANVCVSLSNESFMLHCYVLRQSLESQVAPGAKAVRQLQTLECQIDTHTHMPNLYTVSKQLYVCLFIPFFTCMHIHAPSYWHMLLYSTHDLQRINVLIFNKKMKKASGKNKLAETKI